MRHNCSRKDDALQGSQWQVRQVRHAWREADVMPRGSHHDETGLLLEDHGPLSLSRDAGGTWRLDVSPSAKRMVGCRVRVIGARADFDLLDVSQIKAVQPSDG